MGLNLKAAELYEKIIKAEQKLRWCNNEKDRKRWEKQYVDSAKELEKECSKYFFESEMKEVAKHAIESKMSFFLAKESDKKKALKLTIAAYGKDTDTFAGNLGKLTPKFPELYDGIDSLFYKLINVITKCRIEVLKDFKRKKSYELEQYEESEDVKALRIRERILDKELELERLRAKNSKSSQKDLNDLFNKINNEY